MKIILLVGLVACISYAFLQRDKSRFVAWAMTLLSLLGMLLVIHPELATTGANLLGVGRGVDLIMYFWILLSVLVMMNLQFKIFALQRMVTDLAREVAIRTSATPSKNDI